MKYTRGQSFPLIGKRQPCQNATPQQQKDLVALVLCLFASIPAVPLLVSVGFYVSPTPLPPMPGPGTTGKWTGINFSHIHDGAVPPYGRSHPHPFGLSLRVLAPAHNVKATVHCCHPPSSSPHFSITVAANSNRQEQGSCRNAQTGAVEREVERERAEAPRRIYIK